MHGGESEPKVQPRSRSVGSMRRHAAAGFVVLMTGPGCQALWHRVGPPAASGSIVFDSSAAGAGISLETEAALMGSHTLVDRAVELLHLAPADATRLAGEVTVAPRGGGARVLTVEVRDRAPELARQVCDAVMQTYLEQRAVAQMQPGEQRMEALSAQMEELTAHDAGAARLDAIRSQFEAVQLWTRATTRDVRVLDRCRAFVAPSPGAH